MHRSRRRVLGAFAGLGPVLAATPFGQAAAETWPDKPIKMMMPYAAGGPTDVTARAISAQLGRLLGQACVVENKLGAGGNIASEFVAKAPADGHTALYHSSGIAVTPALYKRLGYDPANDFAPVAMPAIIPLVMVAGPALPANVNTVEKLAQYLKENPGKVSYGSGGIGNITHLGIELLLQGTGTRAVHVPYKGTAPAMTDLIGGQTHFMVDALSSALPYIRDGRVRPLAVTSLERTSVLPAVPTVAEALLPGFQATTWHGILLPAATPKPIVAKLNEAVNKVVGMPEIVRQFTPQGVELRTSTPEAFNTFLRAEITRWTTAARNAGVQPE